MLKSRLLSIINEVNKDKNLKWNVIVSNSENKIIVCNNYMGGMEFEISIEKAGCTSKIYLYDGLDDEYPIDANIVYNSVLDEEIEHFIKNAVKIFYRIYY